MPVPSEVDKRRDAVYADGLFEKIKRHGVHLKSPVDGSEFFVEFGTPKMREYFMERLHDGRISSAYRVYGYVVNEVFYAHLAILKKHAMCDELYIKEYKNA